MSGVDVLAVMDEALNDCKWLLRNSTKTMEVAPQTLSEARAAVAELIEQVQDTLQSHPVQLPYPDGPCIEREQRAQLQSALARVTGVSDGR